MASKCAFRESRCSMSSRSRHDPLTFFQMQVHVPGLPAQLHVCHCQLGQLHGQTRSGPRQVNIFRSLFPSLFITNQCVSITTIPSSGEIYETNARPVMLEILIRWGEEFIGSPICVFLSKLFHYKSEHSVQLSMHRSKQSQPKREDAFPK